MRSCGMTAPFSIAGPPVYAGVSWIARAVTSCGDRITAFASAGTWYLRSTQNEILDRTGCGSMVSIMPTGTPRMRTSSPANRPLLLSKYATMLVRPAWSVDRIATMHTRDEHQGEGGGETGASTSQSRRHGTQSGLAERAAGGERGRPGRRASRRRRRSGSPVRVARISGITGDRVGKVRRGSPPWPVRGYGLGSAGVAGWPVCGSVSCDGSRTWRIQPQVGERRVDERLHELPGEVGQVRLEERARPTRLAQRHRVGVEQLDRQHDAFLAVVDDRQDPVELVQRRRICWRLSSMNPAAAARTPRCSRDLLQRSALSSQLRQQRNCCWRPVRDLVGAFGEHRRGLGCVAQQVAELGVALTESLGEPTHALHRGREVWRRLWKVSASVASASDTGRCPVR